MSILAGKKVVIIGDRDGIPGMAIEECAKSAGAVEVNEDLAGSLKHFRFERGLIYFQHDFLSPCQKILGLPVIAVYENGEMIDSCVKDDATPENVEAMIKKYA